MILVDIFTWLIPMCSPQRTNYGALRPCFGWAPLDVIKHTFKNTTQLARQMHSTMELTRMGIIVTVNREHHVLCFDAMLLVQMQCWDAMLVMVCFDHFNLLHNNNKIAQNATLAIMKIILMLTLTLTLMLMLTNEAKARKRNKGRRKACQNDVWMQHLWPKHAVTRVTIVAVLNNQFKGAPLDTARQYGSNGGEKIAKHPVMSIPMVAAL
jgi:hypothetical protein